MKIEVVLSDTEVKAMSMFMSDIDEWVQNVVHDRARIAMDAVVESETQRMIADPNVTEIPATKEEIIAQAIPQETIETFNY